MKVVLQTVKRYITRFPSLIGFGVLLIACSFLSPVFWTITNWTNIMRQSVILGICSLGLTFVILTGHNDLSISGVLPLTSVLFALQLRAGIPVPVAIIGCIIAGGLFGLFNGSVLSFWNMEPFVVTYGMQVLAQGLGFLISGGAIVILKDIPQAALDLVGLRVGKIPVCFVVMIVLYAFAQFVLSRTRFGRYVYAVGGNPEVCYLSGMSVKNMRRLVYMINGMCVGLAGVLLFSRTTVGDPSSGATYTLQAISACIIGGCKFNGGIGNVFYTLIGVLIVGIISNILNLAGASYYIQLIVQGLIIISAVAMSSKRRKD